MRALLLTTQDLVAALQIVVPIYCTNGAPVLFGGGTPIDLGRCFPDNKRVFGDHKTIRGFLSGLVVGGIVGLLEAVLGRSTRLFELAIIASLGALLGDLGGAFAKRRLGIEPGRPLPGIDQLDFVVGAIVAVSWIRMPSFGSLIILFCLTPPIHLLANFGAYKLGLKTTYW